MRKWIALTTGVFVMTAAAAAFAQDAGEAQRERLMKAMGGAARTLTQMSKGATPYDAAAATAAFTVIQNNAKAIPAAFAAPPGPGVTSEASPRIWENMADFAAHAKALEDDAAAAIKVAGNGVDAIGPALAAVGKDCGACHQTYRRKN